MNVVLATTDYAPLIGGVSRYATSLVDSMRREGANVHVVTTVPGAPDEGVTRVEGALSGLRLAKIAPLARATARVARERRADAIVATAWGHEGIAARWVSRRTGIPYVVMAHGTEILQSARPGLRRSVMRRVLHDAAIVVANSTFTRGLVEAQGVPRTRTLVLHPPVPLDGLRSDGPLPAGIDGKRVLLTASRLARRKGHLETIRALGRIREKYPDVVYVMTGEGPMRGELERIAEEEGVASRVVMPGFVSRETLGALFRRCEVYVSPSLDDEGDVEGFGIALAEAAACGRPVIAGRSGGVADVVLDGETGILVDPRDPEDVALALARLLDDPALAGRMGEAGRARVAQAFAPARQARLLVGALATLREAHA